jgi:exo-1,4-beta-D-glucosaminidase
MLGVCFSAFFAANVFAQSSFAVNDWSLQSSANVTEGGEVLSAPGFSVKNWYPALVPGTVLGALAKDKLVPNPYYGVNLRNIIGDKFNSDRIQAELPMDPTSRFAVPWWYRTEFTLAPGLEGKTVWLRFGGIKYLAQRS